MKCYNEVCPKCRKSLEETQLLKDRKLVTVWRCKRCEIDYDIKPHVICGSKEFITPLSHKKDNDHVNMRLVVCKQCHQGYTTVEKIVHKQDYSGYMELLEKYNDNYNLFENEGK